jgi:hypothetical protein
MPKLSHPANANFRPRLALYLCNAEFVESIVVTLPSSL